MKNFLGLVLISGFAFLTACEPDDKPEPKHGKLIVNVINHVDGVPVVLDSMDHVNAAGNRYGITRLQYYLSNFQFLGAECGDFIPADDYHLISQLKDPNIGDPNMDYLFERTSFEYEIPVGCYDKFTFSIGVDPKRNSEGPYTGDLDFIWNMNWSWSGDYIFFKHEGLFINDVQEEQNYIFHVGNETFYKTSPELSFVELLEIVEGQTYVLNLYANINEFFTDPYEIDLNQRSATMEPGTLGDSLSTNYADMFTFEVE